jgi:tripartite-type tricarboxylate transporter receptor subunit TctC
VGDFVAAAKAHPGALNYGTPAPAVTLAMELFKSLAGIDVQRVVYRGGAPAVQSVISNETQVTFLPPVSAMPSIQSGSVRPLAVAGLRRLSALPDTPTISEGGVAGFEAGSWAGLLAPAHTPAAIVDQLYTELVSLLEPPEMRRRFADLGMDINPMPPAEFDRFLAAQIGKWTKVAKAHHIVGED